MPDRTQDLTNHRKVAVACKKYTDDKIKKVYFDIGHNDISTDDYEGLAYSVTAPAGAKLLQLQSIGGNTVKYNPSVASDNNSTMMKTMPSTVYDFDVSKVEGASYEVNQLVKNGNYATNSDWGDYLYASTISISNGVITATTNNANNQVGFGQTFYDIANHKYLFVINLTAYSSGLDVYGGLKGGEQQINLGFNTFISTIGTTNNEIGVRSSNTDVPNSYISCDLFMLFDLTAMGIDTNDVSVATAELLKRGINIYVYTPNDNGSIRNFQWNGIKVEGANLFDINTNEKYNYQWESWTSNPPTSAVTNTYINGNTIVCNERGGTLSYLGFKVIFSKIGTYTLTFNKNNTERTAYTILDYTSNTVVQWYENLLASGTITIQFTITDLTKEYYIGFTNYSGSSILSNVMLNYGSTALAYVPYIAPTTIPIDITTIKDGNNQSLWADGKLRLNDSIEPYKATKGRTTYIFTGNENWSFRSSDTNCDYYRTAYDTLTPYGKPNNEGGLICDNGYVKGNAYSGNQTGLIFIDNGIIYVSVPSGANPNAIFESGVVLEYELATPIEVSINWASILRGITGYSNGTISLLNTNNMDTANVIDYNSIIKETLATAVKLEGANLWSLTQPAFTGIINISSFLQNIGVGNYAFKVTSSRNVTYPDFHWYIRDETTATTLLDGILTNTQYTFNYTNELVGHVIQFYSWGQDYSANCYMMWNKGSTALSYRPHKATVTRALPYQASDGWSAGSVRNVRVFSDEEGNAVKKRENNINKQDIGLLNWAYSDSLGASNMHYEAYLGNAKYSDQNTIFNGVCSKYEAISFYNLNSGNYDKAISYYGVNDLDLLCIKDSYYNNAITFKLANTNEPLYYELDDSSKTESDIDDFDYYFDVDEGDVITFVNANNQQVYATYSFLIKEAKV